MTVAMKLSAIAAFWIAVGLVQTFNWGHGFPKAIVLFLLLLAVPIIIRQTRVQPTPLPSWLQRAAVTAFALFLALDLVYLGLRILHPHLIDIATTTLAAGDALLHGANPYEAPIDTGPDAAAAGLTSYKYLPVMIAAYLPLGAPLGERGIILTNLALLLACLGLMWCLARSILAPLLFVMLPLVAEQLFAKGATDLVAVLPLLAAFALSERSPFFSGLCVGLSIAAKPVPGGLFVPCLLPPTARGRYVAGIAAGLLPLLPFLLLSPQSFLANTIWFNLSRPADTTSWLAGAPAAIVTTAHYAMLAFIAAVFAYVARRTPTLAARCGLGVMLTIAAILTGPGAHHNYQLWWLPLYGVILSLALAAPQACEATSLRYTSGIGMDARGS